MKTIFRVVHLKTTNNRLSGASLRNVVGFRTVSVLISDIVHSKHLSIGSGPRVTAPDLQHLILLTLVPDVSLLLARGSIAGLVTV